MLRLIKGEHFFILCTTTIVFYYVIKAFVNTEKTGFSYQTTCDPGNQMLDRHL